MVQEKRLFWKNADLGQGDLCSYCYNKKGEHLGMLVRERLGAFMHWLWYQEKDVFMSAGCIDEMRAWQKYLSKNYKEVEWEKAV